MCLLNPPSHNFTYSKEGKVAVIFSSAIAENLLCNVRCCLARSGRENQKSSQDHSPAVMHATYSIITKALQ